MSCLCSAETSARSNDDLPADWRKLKTAQRPENWLLMRSLSLKLLWFSPLIAFDFILGIILLVAGLLLLAPSVQQSLR